MTTSRGDRYALGEDSGGENTPAVIETRGLTKTYGHVVALKALDLSVRKNSIFGFLGPNGAGKSTTMKLLLGLARPTSGSGSVFGKDILSEDFQIRRRVGYLAQDPRFYGHMSARETLRFGARFFYSGPESAIERRVDESLSSRALGSGGPQDQGLLRRRTAATGASTGPDKRPGAIDPGRARGLAGSDGPPRCAGDHGAAAR